MREKEGRGGRNGQEMGNGKGKVFFGRVDGRNREKMEGGQGL